MQLDRLPLIWCRVLSRDDAHIAREQRDSIVTLRRVRDWLHRLGAASRDDGLMSPASARLDSRRRENDLYNFSLSFHCNREPKPEHHHHRAQLCMCVCVSRDYFYSTLFNSRSSFDGFMLRGKTYTQHIKWAIVGFCKTSCIVGFLFKSLSPWSTSFGDIRKFRRHHWLC